MDDARITRTRRSLHAVAELVIAGPQYRAVGTIRLQATPGGFGAVRSSLRVEGTDLVRPGGRSPLAGTCRALAEAAGVEVGAPEGLYHDGADLGPDDELVVEEAAAGLIAEWFARGDSALRTFAPDISPVLWPEHFDLAISLDGVNYGVSPGDSAIPHPYAYVGPWTPREGEFWNVPFGAVRTMEQVADHRVLAAFFAEGRERAAEG
ncbi:hypothetical protein SAMN05443637_106141 [Pseudonocardia thermophila]|uniref:Uncharacterized protein n=1 Tax=Pseudonocardia thermophila TaxID=1848 RepID=A0A1M6SHB0_PSETH|nr:hypothetical protein [Pseudonocardia thermophila]SHK43987.1 hypothetical protein SAMN05443637_106141 [Pseudonocardia thermophila]